VDSATPSIKPMVAKFTPNVDTRNNGSVDWIILELISANRLTKPRNQTLRGTFRCTDNGTGDLTMMERTTIEGLMIGVEVLPTNLGELI
jgi:hypothetical protein